MFFVLVRSRGLEPLTFGLGNRFGYQHFNDLRPNVANVLHPFLRRKILITCPRFVVWCPAAPFDHRSLDYRRSEQQDYPEKTGISF